MEEVMKYINGTKRPPRKLVGSTCTHRFHTTYLDTHIHTRTLWQAFVPPQKSMLETGRARRITNTQ